MKPIKIKILAYSLSRKTVVNVHIEQMVVRLRTRTLVTYLFLHLYAGCGTKALRWRRLRAVSVASQAYRRVRLSTKPFNKLLQHT